MDSLLGSGHHAVVHSIRAIGWSALPRGAHSLRENPSFEFPICSFAKEHIGNSNDGFSLREWAPRGSALHPMARMECTTAWCPLPKRESIVRIPNMFFCKSLTQPKE